jgi:hypothetical protein
VVDAAFIALAVVADVAQNKEIAFVIDASLF